MLNIIASIILVFLGLFLLCRTISGKKVSLFVISLLCLIGAIVLLIGQKVAVTVVAAILLAILFSGLMVALLSRPGGKGDRVKTLLREGQMVLLVAVLAVVVTGFTVGAISYSGSEPAAQTTTAGGVVTSSSSQTSSQATKKEEELHYYTDDVDNNNFGPSLKGSTAEEIAADIKTRVSKDPAFLAVTIVAAEEAKGQFLIDGAKTSSVEERINSLHQIFLSDQGKRKQAISLATDFLNQTEKTLDSAYRYNGEQMYMEGSGTGTKVVIGGGVTEVTPALVLTGTNKTVPLRLACGGQWLLSTQEFQSPPTAVPAPESSTPPPTPPESSVPPVSSNPVKDPSKDPVNQGNAPRGGGSNLPDDGPGEYQPSEPSWQPSVDPTPPDPSPEPTPSIDPIPSSSSVPPTDPIPVDPGTETDDGKKPAEEPPCSSRVPEPD